MLTVKQVSKLAYVTTRTLHYYDQIGLFKPDFIGDNGYRYYSDESLLKLQQILFYRELDIPLEQIKEIINREDYDLQEALEEHKRQLDRRIKHIEHLIETVDQTLKFIKGEEKMNKKVLFEAFNEEEQEKMQQEALQMYDPETVKESYKKWNKYSVKEKQRIADEGNAVYQGFVDAMDKGPASADAQECVQRWRTHMNYFWTPDEDQLLGLTDLYNDDPRFRKNFDKIHPKLAEFVRQAVTIYLKNNA